MASRGSTQARSAKRSGHRRAADGRTSYCERCSKVSFHNELDAKIALMKRTAKEKGEKRTYPCPARRGWHLTSKE